MRLNQLTSSYLGGILKRIFSITIGCLLIPVLSGCSGVSPFNGNCESLKIVVQESRATLSVLDGKYEDGLVWLAEPLSAAGYDSVKTYLDELLSHNDNIEAVLASGLASPVEEGALKALLEDFNEDRSLANLVVDSQIWADKTHKDLDKVAEICRF